MASEGGQRDAATPGSAILLVIAAGLSFSFLDTSAKALVVAGIAAPFVSWVRFAVHVLLFAALARPWHDLSVLKARSLALQTLQLAQTTSIFFFAPMVITALAGPLLGEWAGWRRWMAILFGFAGVLVITRPGLAAFEIGHAYALSAMLSYSCYVIMTRAMVASETAESLIFYSALAPTVLMLPPVPATAVWPEEPLQWFLLLSLGFYGGFGHWMLINAYRQATISALAPYPYLQMVWMILFGLLFFGQFPDTATLVGAAIIVASGLYIVHREHRLRLKSRSAPNAEDEELAKKL